MEHSVTDWLDQSPRPNILKRLASAMGFGRYLQSTVAETDNISSQQGKTRDFNPKIAVDNFFSLVYAAAQMNANAVARTPLRLYGRTRKGKTANFPMHRVPSRRKQYLAGRLADMPSTMTVCKVVNFGEDFQEITDHPALDVLRGVNKWMNAYDMSVLRILYLELTGNAYCYVRNGSIRGRTYPMELWPMPSQWMKVIPSRDESNPIISAYMYGRNDGEALQYEPDEVIRWNYPNPRNLYYGLGKVEASWREICLRNSKSAHDQAVFDNGARPDYAVLLKGAREGEATRFQKELEQRLRGVRNRGKFAVVNADQVDIKPLTFTAEELGDQDRVIEAICNVFGVPVAKFMSNKAVAGGQAGVSDVAYLRDTVLPICRMDEETLNSDFLTRFDGAADDLVFAYDNPVPEDRAAQLQDDTMRLAQGVITRDEWRTENGYDAAGGQAAVLLVPNNLVPVDMAGAQQVQAEPVDDEADDESVNEPDDATTKAIASLERALESLGEKIVTKGEDGAGHWVTIEGAHVFIGTGGVIEKGPAHLVGKKPGDIGKEKRGESPKEKTPLSEKAKKAKETSRYVGADVQRYSEEHNEMKFAKQIGGVALRDNEPVDVIVHEDGVVKHGVELKTMFDNKQAKVYMKREAMQKKRAWMKKNHADFHTVVFDDQKVYNAKGEGQHGPDSDRGIYYKRGVGSFRVSAMQKVKGVKELRQLMEMKTSELPDAAKPSTAYPKVSRR